MKFSSFLFAMTTLFVVRCFADNVCINGMADYEKRKAQMSPVAKTMFNTLPVAFTVDNMAVTSAIKIQPAGDKLKLIANVNAIGKSDDFQLDAYIKEVCIVGNQVTMKIEAPKAKPGQKIPDPPTIQLVDANTVKIKGFDFKKSSEAQFRAINNKVQQDLGGSSGSGVN